MPLALQLRLAWRQLTLGRQLLTLPAILSVFGMALGVASLVMAMGVFTGFQRTLERAIRGVTGDVVVIKSGGHLHPEEEILAKIKILTSDVATASPFVQLEGLVAVKGRVAGAMLQGVDLATVSAVSDVQQRVVRGEFKIYSWQEGDETYSTAVIGAGLARKMNLNPGDDLRFVLPVAAKTHQMGFAPKILRLRVAGIMDLGKYDFDERFIITEISAAQQLAGFRGSFTGYRLGLKDPKSAGEVQRVLATGLGSGFWIRSWQQLNQNIIKAAQLEKIVIFFVVSIMILAASLNVAGHLYVSILRKFSEISILRTMGARSKFISTVFSVHGLLVGLVGAVIGVVLGLVGTRVVEWVVRSYDLLPPQVYRISNLQVVVSWTEIALIMFSSAVICYLATWLPARRGGNLSIIEGIRHE